MKKYILAVVLFLLFVSVGFCNTDLSKLAGKQIYRDVPVNSKSFFSKEYMNIKYELYSYDDSYIELKQIEGIEYGKKILLSRSLWDDGNWKEEILSRVDKFIETHSCAHNTKYSKTIISLKSLIGKKIYRTRAYGIDDYHVIDKSYMDEPRRLIDITCKYIILESDITNPVEKSIKLDRDQWDDGYWEEWREAKRLLVRELVGNETAGLTLSDWTSSYHCVVCGGNLITVWNRNVTWYCSQCKKHFNIEKK